MSAFVFPPFQRKTLAWCEQCQDGVRTTKAQAQEWADKHNADRHEEPK